MAPALKYAQAAALVRAQVTDGTLKPGQAAPSGAQLARLTGFAPLTCRRALMLLIAEGVLVPGTSPAARPRVAAPDGAGSGAAGMLPRALAARRHAAGLRQPDLAALTGYSVTSIGHAETGRLWQSRAFWEKTDLALAAGGQLVALFDACRAGGTAPGTPAAPAPEPPAPAVARVVLHFSDGTAASYYPPALPLPPHGTAFPPQRRRAARGNARQRCQGGSRAAGTAPRPAGAVPAAPDGLVRER